MQGNPSVTRVDHFVVGADTSVIPAINLGPIGAVIVLVNYLNLNWSIYYLLEATSQVDFEYLTASLAEETG